MVILLGNGVLGSEPYVLLGIESEVEAASCKALNGLVLVVKSLDNACAVLEIIDKGACFLAVLVGAYQLTLGALLHLHLGVLVNIAVSVTGNGDRLCPCGDIGSDALYDDRCTENGTVKDSTDSAVGGLPHFLQVVLGHSCGIGGDGCALYSNAVLLCSLCGVDSYLVVGLVSVLKSKVIVFGLEVNVRGDKDILYHLPDNSGHFISVHLDERCFHLNFICHFILPPEILY